MVYHVLSFVAWWNRPKDGFRAALHAAKLCIQAGCPTPELAQAFSQANPLPLTPIP